MSEEEEVLPETVQTLWHAPSMSERLTWTQARALIRDNLAAYSGLQIPQHEIDAALKRAVARAYPRSFMVLTHQGIITDGYVDSVILPWPAEKILFFGLSGGDPTLPLETRTLALGSGAIDLAAGRVRFLLDSRCWPYQAATQVTFTARVVSKPQPESVCPDYCPLTPDMLLLLTEHELWPFYARTEGMNQTAITAQQHVNWTALRDMLPRQRMPAHLGITGMQSVSSTIWHSWGQEDITFGDLS